jgi:hypothetical protein
MWFYSTALILLVLLTGYFFVLPLYKKRPALIKMGGIVIYSILLFIALFPILGSWSFIIAIAVVLFLYLLNPWFVYGTTNAMLSDALEKATSATRTPIEKLANVFKIDGNMEVRFFNLAGKINIVLLRKAGDSKKSKLMLAVFKKFIQNYFI